MTPPSLPHLVHDRFLPDAEHAALLAWARKNEGRFEDAWLGDGTVNHQVRMSLSLRDLGPMRAVLRDRIATQVADWVRALRVTSFPVADIELELVAHPDGAHFAMHYDVATITPSARGDRMLSAVYYFHREPPAFSGGILRMHNIGAQQGHAGTDIAPLQNRLVVFPSWSPHEVLPVSCPSRRFEDSRFAINCWVYGPSRVPRVAQAGA